MSTPRPPSAMSALDAAILERIITILAPKKLAPHKRLAPLLRVNKHWHALARRRLYAAISLKGRWVSRPLRTTLEANPALAALVEELVMDTELSAQDPRETADHMRIVAACANLRHLTVLGYASADVGRYREAIAGRASLVTLNVSEGKGMFTFAQLLEMLAGWPTLEKLILKDALLPAEGGGAVQVQVQGAPCAQLKMVKIIDTLDAATHFSFAAFAAVAPAVSVLWVQPQHAMPADLLDGLRTWAPTLEALCLLSDSESHLESILPFLPALKHLDTHSQMLSPLALSSLAFKLTKLEALTYRIFPAQLLDLAETLALPGVLPGLRALEVRGVCARLFSPRRGSTIPPLARPRTILSLSFVVRYFVLALHLPLSPASAARPGRGFQAPVDAMLMRSNRRDPPRQTDAAQVHADGGAVDEGCVQTKTDTAHDGAVDRWCGVVWWGVVCKRRRRIWLI
ncbi:hypothetical protein C8R47DRAFT_1170815 [Mycena vitilis]|nr:hypothetical protein C8R47DRAFT_1170815 [Mycena vitilis]